MTSIVETPEWIEECTKFYGRVLTGVAAHWCDEFDGLPNDETCGDQFWACCICMWTDDESCRDYAKRCFVKLPE